MLLVSGFSAAERSLAATEQCYWMENTSGQFNWVPAGWAPSKTDCYKQDSCSGGLGESGGGCYKWALSASSNGVPWR